VFETRFVETLRSSAGRATAEGRSRAGWAQRMSLGHSRFRIGTSGREVQTGNRDPKPINAQGGHRHHTRSARPFAIALTLPRIVHACERVPSARLWCQRTCTATGLHPVHVRRAMFLGDRIIGLHDRHHRGPRRTRKYVDSFQADTKNRRQGKIPGLLVRRPRVGGCGGIACRRSGGGRQFVLQKKFRHRNSRLRTFSPDGTTSQHSG